MPIGCSDCSSRAGSPNARPSAVVTVDLVQEPTPSLPEFPAPRTVPAGRRRSTPRAHVVAVLLARDGAARLPRVLAALASGTRAPDALVGVDLGSTDESAALLAAG